MIYRAILVSLLLVVILGCWTGSQAQIGSTGVLQSTASSSTTPSPEAGQQTQSAFELIRGPMSEDGLQAIFATPDLGVGAHRVAFALTSKKGLVDAPSATVQSFYEPQGETRGEPVQTALAIFRPFPLVERGLYATKLRFDRPGRWRIQATVTAGDGLPRRAELDFDVPDSTLAPAVGDATPPSVHRTIHDVERISQLTTGSLQDPDLYQTTIADAIGSGLPTVIVVASPAFCTNAVCGPQVEVLSQLKDEFKEQANFIHVDFFDNPEEIQGDLNRAVESSIVRAWMLPSSEWSFVIDRSGVIAGRFEGFATLGELRAALKSVLES